MGIFKTHEFEIKTARTKESVIKDLTGRATFDNDTFKIKSEVFSLRRGSRITGKVLNDGPVTTVKIKILPSSDYKAVAVMWFGFLIIFFGFFLIKQIQAGQFSIWTFVFPVFGLFGYLMFRLLYWFSVEMQKSSIENLVSGRC
jgi:hypothetical protein